MIKQEIAPGVWQEAEPIKFQTGCFWKVLALVVPAIVLVLTLLCSCAPAPCWQQEQELRELLPDAEIALTDIPAPVAAEIVRAVRYCKDNYPPAVSFIKSMKSDYALSKKSSFPTGYYAITSMAMLYPYNSIKLNDAALQSLTSVRKQYQSDVWLGFHVAVPRNQEMFALTLHELAHVLTANLSLHDELDIIRLYQIYQMEVQGGVNFASNAGLNVIEFIAECFVDGVCNGQKANGISQSVMKVIDRRIAK